MKKETEEMEATVEEHAEEVTEQETSEETTDDSTDENARQVNSREVELELQVADLNQRILRVQADYDNFRRRSREEKESAAKYRSQNVIEGLLPVLDNFERALLVEPENEEAKSLLTGMEMVYRQLQEALKNEGIEVIPTVGENFDPHRHQAVMQVEEEGYESNQIVAELQKGYLLKDKVIRPSMVKVNA
ncbi:protein GrpE [Alkalihalobacillus pseudalcaliphilus]|nr:protein GrpE [Alkalihalobacillus pseudalcaliphilus]